MKDEPLVSDPRERIQRVIVAAKKSRMWLDDRKSRCGELLKALDELEGKER